MTPWPYWLLTALLVVLCVCVGIIAGQRDKAQMERDTYRDALWRADPDEARQLSVALKVGLQ